MRLSSSGLAEWGAGLGKLRISELFSLRPATPELPHQARLRRRQRPLVTDATFITRTHERCSPGQRWRSCTPRRYYRSRPRALLKLAHRRKITPAAINDTLAEFEALDLAIDRTQDRENDRIDVSALCAVRVRRRLFRACDAAPASVDCEKWSAPRSGAQGRHSLRVNFRNTCNS